ncbi:MAG: sigma-70 family RNA polymerase sigma factor [Bryobacteraceae bacterium]|jgi:RNA polymerase sigma-70 factor (ECF subfamily)
MIEAVATIAFPESKTAAREARFADLVARQSRFVFRVAYALLRNAHDAEDAVQETFLKLYRGGAWEAIENERAFLARVAWRVSVDKLRKVRHEPLDPQTVQGGASPEDAAVTADWNATVHRLVDTLPPELRQPLALSTVNELTSREIAEVMGIAEGTVRTRIMRARQILKQKLGELQAGRYGK